MKTILRLHFLVIICLIGFSGTSHAQPAQFNVTTDGTTPQIDSAIDYALNIWSQNLQSSIPIKINVRYTQLIGGTLGISFPNGVRDFSNAPMANTWYPTAMANAMVGYELNPGEHDMDIYINSQQNWYFGLDGNTPFNQHDFVSVFLHEVCHSLGIISLGKSKDNEGSFGELVHGDFFFLPTTFGFFDQEGFPSVYDRYLQDNAGDGVVDNPNYDSIALHNLFTGNQLYLQSDSIQHLTGGDTLVRVYAPASFALGSSLTHFDENTYNNTNNALMTPQIGTGQVEHEPGPILSALLYDLGWKFSGQFTSLDYKIESIPQLRAFPNPATDYLQFEFTETIDEIHIYNFKGQEVAFKRSGKQTRIDIQELPAGQYILVIESKDRFLKDLFIKQ